MAVVYVTAENPIVINIPGPGLDIYWLGSYVGRGVKLDSSVSTKSNAVHHSTWSERLQHQIND